MNDDHELAATLAKAITLACVRNTSLENLHGGTWPHTECGDYSDVTVLTPEGEIPWNQVSRISDPEMKILMQEVVDKIYTFLIRHEDSGFKQALYRFAGPQVTSWDSPKLLPNFIVGGRPEFKIPPD